MGWHALGEILFLLVSAVVMASILERFRISSIVGYLLGGMLVGPGFLGLVGDGGGSTARYEVMTELGVSLLLFTIGLEITPAKLRLFGIRGGMIGLTQVVLTIIAVMGLVLISSSASWSTAFAVGCMVTLSSTAVVMRILTDRTEVDAPYGRDAMSVLLLQDLAVVPMLIILGLLGDTLPASAEDAPSLGDTTLPMLLGVGLLVLIAIFVLPKLLGSSVFRRNRDFPVILAFATALTAAWATHALGLSAELGAFIAGIILARTEFARQIRADVSALKAIFLTLFFASVGLLADINWFIADFNWVQVLAVCAVGIIVKTVIVAGIIIASGGRISSSIRTGLTVAQIGEFSFVVGSIAFAHGLLGESGFQVLVSATLLSLLATPGLIAIAERAGMFVEQTCNRFGIGRAQLPEADDGASELSGHVIVAGYGPAGEEAARSLRLAGLETLVVDLNPALVAKARAEGMHADLGNSAQREILEHLNLEVARALIVTVPDPASLIATIEQARIISPDILIIARARYRKLIDVIENAGADHVLAEESVIGTLLGSTAVSIVSPESCETG